MSTALRPRSRNSTLSTRVSYVANSPPLYHFKQHRGMLIHLPEDILLDVIHYLEVRDVLTLRKVRSHPLTSYRVIADNDHRFPGRHAAHSIRLAAMTTCGTSSLQHFPCLSTSPSTPVRPRFPEMSCSTVQSRPSVSMRTGDDPRRVFVACAPC